MLTGWDKITSEFEAAFGFPLHFSGLHDQIKRLWLFFFVMPLCLFSILGVGNFWMSVFTKQQNLTISLIRALSSFYVIIGTVSLQMLYILVCHLMSEIFKAVHYQILNKLVTVNKKRLGENTILKWRFLIGVLHGQIRNICEFISPTSIVMLVFRVIIISTSIYTILFFSGGTPNIILHTNETVYDEYINYPNRLTNNHPATNFVAVTVACNVLLITFAMQLIDVHFAELIYNSVSFF